MFNFLVSLYKKQPVISIYGKATIILVFLLQFTFGGTSGKIAGRVTDIKTQSGLAGVNMIINGTFLGSATDEDGYFTILNVPPGTYDLTASMIGYSQVTVLGVTVVIDRTTQVKIQLSSKALEIGEIIVEADRPLVVPDVSASQLNLDENFIQGLPISNIAQAISLQAGIEGLSIRGGGQTQTAFIVDGFLMNDERSNNPYTSMSLNSVREIQIQTGGFNAEYGNIRSGVINVVTDEGEKNRYRGTFSYYYSPPAPKNFGPSVYGPESYFLRPFLDSAVCWGGTAQGSWDSHTQKQYPSFEGWNAVADATLQDNDPTNDLTPAGAQRVFQWQHRRNGNIKQPDYTLDGSITGPVPVISKILGDLRFNLSHQQDQDMFVFPLSRDRYGDQVTRLKLTSDIGSNIKLTLLGHLGVTQSVSPYNWKVTPTGTILKSSYSVANLVNSSSGNSILFMPGYFSPTTIERRMVGIKINHMLNNDTYYELLAQRMINEYDTYQVKDRDTTRVFEVVPGYFLDEAPYGYWGYAESAIDGTSIGGWMNLGRDESVNTTTILRFDFTHQLNFHHQLKAGLHGVVNNYNIKSFTESPSMSTWRRSMVYDVSPYRMAGYVQDKLEFEGFIANAGLRFEYASANSDIYDLTAYDDYYKQGIGHDIEGDAPTEKSKSVFTISPRLGISHPITENSKLYFNYGHFQSEPASSYRFRLQRESNGLVTHMGNPDMTYQRTIAYEVGYSHALSDKYLLNIAAYYKDVADQPGWIYYQNIDGAIQYNKAANNNYEDIRGLEFTLSKPTGRWITGFINYTYMVKTSGYFGLTKYYQDPNMQREYEQLNPYQEKPRPLPYARINLNFHTPRDFGLKLFDIYLFGDWHLNVLGNYKTGSYETFNPNSIPGVVDNVQWKDRYNVDLRFSKSVSTLGAEIELFADVYNALNTRFLSYAGFSDYYDYLDYMESLRFTWEEGKEKGNDRIGDFREEGMEYQPYEPTDWQNPTPEEQKILDAKAYIDMPNFKSLTFLDPRKITFGLKFRF